MQPARRGGTVERRVQGIALPAAPAAQQERPAPPRPPPPTMSTLRAAARCSCAARWCRRAACSARECRRAALRPAAPTGVPGRGESRRTRRRPDRLGRQQLVADRARHRDHTALARASVRWNCSSRACAGLLADRPRQPAEREVVDRRHGRSAGQPKRPRQYEVRREEHGVALAGRRPEAPSPAGREARCAAAPHLPGGASPATISMAGPRGRLHDRTPARPGSENSVGP